MLYAISMTCPFEDGAAAELHPLLYPSTLESLRAAFCAATTSDLTHPALPTDDEV